MLTPRHRPSDAAGRERASVVGGALPPAGSGGTYDGMEDRIAKLEDGFARLETGMARLEGAVEGVRHSQSMTLGAVGILAALAIGFGVYMLQRLDTLTGQVNAIPDQINSNMRDITKTLAESITAARASQPPTVIVVPGPGSGSLPTSPQK